MSPERSWVADGLPCADAETVPHEIEDRVLATWSRGFLGVQVLAFADHTYEIDIGSKGKPPLVSLGWCRWYPCTLDFPRFQKLGTD
jgi:hypothetical protein